MPYEIKRISNGKAYCWSVVNVETNKVKSYCTTYAKAVRQKRLLESIDRTNRQRP